MGGKYVWADGQCYTGQWQRNKMHGHGRFESPDGRLYEGQYMGDQKEGQGRLRWPEGQEYEGQWKGGKQHGIGVLTEATPGKPRRQGQWANGNHVKWIE